MIVTTENYPSLTHLSRMLLNKDEKDPFPMILTAFDLEIVAHYLKNPYDFLYYVRQRIKLANYIMADEESVILTYHLQNKLWKDPGETVLLLDAGLAEILSQDYIPKNLGFQIDPKNNPLASRWKDDNFDRFIDQLSTHEHPKMTDIIFYLYDLSGDMRKHFMQLVLQTKSKSEQDGKMHSFSVPPDDSYSPRIGFTYMSIREDDEIGPTKRLAVHVELSKYKHKGDIWIGFCGLVGSKLLVNFLVVIEQTWKYDEKLKEAASYLGGTPIGLKNKNKK